MSTTSLGFGRKLAGGCVALLLILAMAAVSRAASDQTITVMSDAVIQWQEDQPVYVDPFNAENVIRFAGQYVEQEVQLPEEPADHRDDRRIVLTLHVEPVVEPGAPHGKPNDPWPRLGSVYLMKPGAINEPDRQIELMRFVTSFGGESTFEQDVTSFAPLLHGKRTLAAFISAFTEEEKPAWRVTLKLRYTDEGIGYRRPEFAQQVFHNPHVRAQTPTLSANIDIPPGLDQPRLRVLSTGHANDGLPTDEFVSRMHVLRVDGRVVAMWRPWMEADRHQNQRNPWAGRRKVAGREIRSSDFDRSGWQPGMKVEPMLIPLPELGPGRHRIELEIKHIGAGSRRAPDDPGHAYWCISAAVLADDPWPTQEADE